MDPADQSHPRRLTRSGTPVSHAFRAGTSRNHGESGSPLEVIATAWGARWLA